jgi:enoyl-CoA hydratase
MPTQGIICEYRESIALIRLNRPEKLNALSRALIEDLLELFRQLKDAPKLRAVILTGEGCAFCSGTDVKDLTELDEMQAIQASRRGQDLCNLVENFPVPVIAAVNGVAAGGGCELALACHLRLASPQAVFSLPEIRLGIIPGYGGTQRLSREIGEAKALELMLTGRSVTASEAFQLRLVNRICGSQSLMSEAESLGNEIAKLAPLAISACLQAVVHGLELPLAEGLDLETKLFAKLFASNDMREGTRAFLEKRNPVFNGT